MKTYTFPVVKTSSGYVMIEANTLKEARKIVDTMPNLDEEMTYSDSDYEIFYEEVEENESE